MMHMTPTVLPFRCTIPGNSFPLLFESKASTCILSPPTTGPTQSRESMWMLLTRIDWARWWRRRNLYGQGSHFTRRRSESAGSRPRDASASGAPCSMHSGDSRRRRHALCFHLVHAIRPLLPALEVEHLIKLLCPRIHRKGYINILPINLEGQVSVYLCLEQVSRHPLPSFTIGGNPVRLLR